MGDDDFFGKDDIKSTDLTNGMGLNFQMPSNLRINL